MLVLCIMQGIVKIFVEYVLDLKYLLLSKQVMKC